MSTEAIESKLEQLSEKWYDIPWKDRNTKFLARELKPLLLAGQACYEDVPAYLTRSRQEWEEAMASNERPAEEGGK